MVQELFRSLEDLGVQPNHSGKVRETVDLGTELFIVTTDRISAFDCVLPQGLPGKGILLNQLSAFWFRGFSRLLPTHFISTGDKDLPERFQPHADALRNRWMRVRKAERIPIECVIRGYLAGSGWDEYKRTGEILGQVVPAGLAEFDRLPAPLFTPTTKEEEGHDRPISVREMAGIVGEKTAEALERLSLEIYSRGAEYALSRGIIIADTKFEFGFIDGKISLIDEVLTPDSSRFWPLESLKRTGRPDPLDKQYVRDYLKTLDWDRNPPAPDLPEKVVAEALDRYRRAYEDLAAGHDSPDWTEMS